jgi:hypothetical protein
MPIEYLNTVIELPQFCEIPKHISRITFKEPANPTRKQCISREYTLLGLKLIHLFILTGKSLALKTGDIPLGSLRLEMI